MTTVVSAAVLDDRTGKVYEGRRHFDLIMGAALDEDLDNSHIHYEHLIQGFVDSVVGKTVSKSSKSPTMLSGF